MFVFQTLKALAEVAADDLGVVHQAIFFNQIDRGFCCNAHDRVAPEGGDLKSLEAGGNVWFRSGESDRHAVRHAFCGRDDVGIDLPLFDPEPFFAGAAPGGLNFVGDEEPAILLHDIEDDLEIFFRRSNKSTYTLNWLGDKRRDLS